MERLFSLAFSIILTQVPNLLPDKQVHNCGQLIDYYLLPLPS